MPSISNSLLSQSQQLTQAERDLNTRVNRLNRRLEGESAEDLSQPEQYDKLSISNEALIKSQERTNTYEVPELASPITHTTDKGNTFTFSTIKKSDGSNQLVLEFKDQFGEQKRFNISEDTVIREDEHGNISFGDIRDGGSDGNDIVIDFLTGKSESFDAKGGNDFVLSLGNAMTASADEVFEKDGETYMVNRDSKGNVVSSTRITQGKTNISTGEGDDTVFLVGQAGENFTVDTGDGDDSVTGRQINNSENSRGLYANISTGAGDDTVSLDGMNNGRIDTGAGDDVVTVENLYGSKENNGVDEGVISTGSGNDKVSVTNNYYGYIETGAGKDTVTVDKLLGDAEKDTSKSGTIDSGEGDDTIIVNTMEKGTIEAGGGSDTMSFDSVKDSTIKAGSGNDSLSFETVKGSYIETGSGQNSVTVRGEMEDVTFNAGGGDVKFMLTNMATSKNVKFLNMSKASANSLMPFINGSQMAIVLKGGDYGINITVNGDASEQANTDTYKALMDLLQQSAESKESSRSIDTIV